MASGVGGRDFEQRRTRFWRSAALPPRRAGEAKGSGGLADAVAGGAGEDLLDFDIAICDLKIRS
jgi:hypothetical protein